MENKVLTISIAAYNVQKYIKDALDSLVVPEILDDIEVFIVDDGGTDNTLDIAREYEKKYPNTFKTVHKENGGYGSTVNYSIENARGKYFKLLDGDDWYDINGLVKLVNILKNTNVDVVVTLFDKYDGKTIKKGIIFDDSLFDKEIKLSNFKYNNGIQMHALTYKLEILKKSGMRLKEHMLYTDNYYATLPFEFAKDILINNFVVYNYRLGLDSQSVNKNVAIRHMRAHNLISYDLCDFYEKCKKEENANLIYLKSRVAATCIDNYRIIICCPISYNTLKELKDFDIMIKSLSYDTYRQMEFLDRYASKIVRLVRNSSYLLYWAFAFLFKFIK